MKKKRYQQLKEMSKTKIFPQALIKVIMRIKIHKSAGLPILYSITHLPLKSPCKVTTLYCPRQQLGILYMEHKDKN